MTPLSTLEVQGRDHFPKDDVVFTDHFQKDDIWRHRPTDCEKIAILDDVVCEWPLTEIFVWNKCNKSSQNMIYRIKWIIKGKYLEVEILMKYYLKSEENISALRLHGKTSNFLHKFCARNWTFKVILLLFEITLLEKKPCKFKN